MQSKTLLIAALSATAMAQGGSLATELASLTSDLGTLSLPSAEFSVFSVLATAIPSSLLTAISDPAVQSSLVSDFEAGNTPSWYSALPSDVESYINSGESETTNLPLSSVASSLTAAVSSVRASATSQISAASASSTVTGSSSASSTGGAPVPTAAVVASMAGVAGVLALAIGL